MKLPPKLTIKGDLTIEDCLFLNPRSTNSSFTVDGNLHVTRCILFELPLNATVKGETAISIEKEWLTPIKQKLSKVLI